MIKLSILIPTTPDREPLFQELMAALDRQIGDREDIQILVAYDNKEKTIGAKRNELLQEAKGEYVCFIDSDDMVSPHYIEILMAGIDMEVDCVSLRGVMTTNGKNPEVFEHSIKYKKYETVEGAGIKYLRYPNHLNCIRASIAKQFSFPEKNHGEDYLWAKKIHESGLIRSEFYAENIIYYYQYIPNK